MPWRVGSSVDVSLCPRSFSTRRTWAGLDQLIAEALTRFQIRDAAVVHRLGRLEIGETSVLIVVTSAHRSAAFDACRWLIDSLKKTVPIWKKEHFEDGAVWADGEPFPLEVATAGTVRFCKRPHPSE